MDTPPSAVQAAIDAVAQLASTMDDETATRQTLRNVALNATPHPALTRQFVELLSCHENPQFLIEFAAHICDGEAAGMQALFDQYRDLLSRDRSFLVPVIGSLGQLPLPEAIKLEVLDLVRNALAVVEEDDVLTVVRALLSSLSASTAAAIIRTLRQQYCSLPMHCTPLVVEMLGATLRVDTEIAAIFLQTLHDDAVPLSTIDVATLVVLAGRRNDRQQILRCFAQMIERGLLHPACLRDVIEQRHVALLSESYAPTWLLVVEHLREGEAGCMAIKPFVEQIYLSLFISYEMLRPEIVGKLIETLTVVELLQNKWGPKRHKGCSGDGQRGSALGQQQGRQAPCKVLHRAAQLLMLLEHQHARLLNEHAHLLEEALSHTCGDPVAYGYLCCLAAKMATINERMMSALIIFCRKSSFSHDDTLQRSTVLLAAFVLNQSHCTTEDQNTLLLLVLRSCLQHPLNSSVQELRELLRMALSKFDSSLLHKILNEHLLPTLHSPKALEDKNVVHTKPCAGYIDSGGRDVVSSHSDSGIQIPIDGWVKQYHRGQLVPPQLFSNTDQHTCPDHCAPALQPLLQCIMMVNSKLKCCDMWAEFQFAMPAMAFTFLQRVKRTRDGLIKNSGRMAESNGSDLVHIAWCCYYAAVAARAILCSMESCNSDVCLQMIAFSHRWLCAGQMATTEFCGGHADTKETASLRFGFANIPAIPVIILTKCVLSHATSAAAVDPELLVSLYSCLFEQISAEGKAMGEAVADFSAQDWSAGTPLLRGILASDQNRSVLHRVQVGLESISQQSAASAVLSTARTSLVYNLIIEQLNIWAQIAEQCRQHPATGMMYGKVVVQWRHAVQVLCYLWKILTCCLELSHGLEKQDLIAKLCSAIIARALPATANKMAEHAFSMETVYRFIVAHFENSSEAHCATLALETLVALTRGVRKSEEVAKLHARFLQTVYPRTEISLSCFISNVPLAVNAGNRVALPKAWANAIQKLGRMIPKCSDHDMNVCAKRLTWHCTISLCALIQSQGVLLGVAADFVGCLDLLWSRSSRRDSRACCAQLPALTPTTAPLVAEVVMHITSLCQPSECARHQWLAQKTTSTELQNKFCSIICDCEASNAAGSSSSSNKIAPLTRTFLKSIIRDLDTSKRSLTDENLRSWPVQNRNIAMLASAFWQLIDRLRKLCAILKTREQQKAQVAMRNSSSIEDTGSEDDTEESYEQSSDGLIARQPQPLTPQVTSGGGTALPNHVMAAVNGPSTQSLVLPSRSRRQGLLPRVTFAVESFNEFLMAMAQRYPGLRPTEPSNGAVTKGRELTTAAPQWTYLKEMPDSAPQQLGENSGQLAQRGIGGVSAAEKELNIADGYDSSSSDEEGQATVDSSLSFRAEARGSAAGATGPQADGNVWGAS